MEPLWRTGTPEPAVVAEPAADRPLLRVALVDDHQEFLTWARALLSASPWIEVVGDTTDPEATLELVSTTKPDLLLVDFEMPGTTGFEVARRVREAAPALNILLMSMHDSAYFEVLARLAGASGFLPKTRFSPDAIASLLG
jgi:two-component system, NarL family, nitrate/nitrite response regulator NarL